MYAGDMYCIVHIQYIVYVLYIVGGDFLGTPWDLCRSIVVDHVTPLVMKLKLVS